MPALLFDLYPVMFAMGEAAPAPVPVPNPYPRQGGKKRPVEHYYQRVHPGRPEATLRKA